MTETDYAEAVLRKFDPLTIYQNLDKFRERLRGKASEKAASVLAVQCLARTKPELARKIFEVAVMEPFYRLLKHEFPGAAELSAEGATRVEEMRSRFMQEPVYALAMLETIFVIERIEPWAEDTVRLLSKGQTTLKEARKYPGTYAALINKGTELAMSDLGAYVRERNYRIMLALVAEIDGTSVEDHINKMLSELPKPQGSTGDFYDDTTESLIGPDAAGRLASWALGDIEF